MEQGVRFRPSLDKPNNRKVIMKQAADITTKKTTESLFLLNLVLIR